MKNHVITAAVLAALALGGARAEIGVTDSEILIGQSAAFSGPAAQLGKDMQAGAEAYFKQVNQQGGINGRRIRLLPLDDGYEPDRAAANTRQLIERERVFALFGYVGTPTSNAALPILSDAKVPLIGPFTGAESLREPINRYVFNVRSSYFDETRSIIDFIGPARARKVAVFYQNDAYGNAGLTGVEKALARYSAAPIAKATVERNSVEVQRAVDVIAQAAPDEIVMVSAYKSCAAFIKAMKKRVGPSVRFWNVSFVGSRALADELGEDGRGVAVSQVVPFPWDDIVPVVKEHRQIVGKSVSFTTLEGYIAAKVLVEGLRRTGRNLTRESFIQSLEGAGRINVGGFSVEYTPTDHRGSKYVDLTLISKNGTFIH